MGTVCPLLQQASKKDRAAARLLADEIALAIVVEE